MPPSLLDLEDKPQTIPTEDRIAGHPPLHEKRVGGALADQRRDMEERSRSKLTVVKRLQPASGAEKERHQTCREQRGPWQDLWASGDLQKGEDGRGAGDKEQKRFGGRGKPTCGADTTGKGENAPERQGENPRRSGGQPQTLREVGSLQFYANMKSRRPSTFSQKGNARDSPDLAKQILLQRMERLPIRLPGHERCTISEDFPGARLEYLPACFSGRGTRDVHELGLELFEACLSLGQTPSPSCRIPAHSPNFRAGGEEGPG